MSTLSHTLVGAALVTLIIAGTDRGAEAAQRVDVWKSPSCSCCGNWIAYMTANGFDVAIHDVDDVDPVKQANGVTSDLASCHTAKIENYVVEGHVPVTDIRRLLAERPAVKGIAVPAMASGAPGMGSDGSAYDVVSFDATGKTQVFAHH
ncbi:MAG: DUF411 domain-containing protein [Ancalomicrobiaceae bacterium]|nr:DUF411 domain-containing protein [Ancalomicrobiaceae bacterium]